MKSVKAIIIGIGSYNDLGLIRSCGETGVRSIYLNHGSKLIVPINKSKYVEDFQYVKPTDIIAVVNKIAKDNLDCNYMVFPASDVAVEAMDQNYNTFEANVYTSHARGNIISLMDKSVMGKLASDAGLLIPQTYVLNLKDKDSIIPFGIPVILKPISSIAGEKSDITICSNELDLNDARKKLVKKGYKEVLAQQYLHNESSEEIGITGVALQDKIIIKGFIHKIRNRANINNYGKVDPDLPREVLEPLKAYIRLTGYQGIFDTDFIKYNDKMYFIECNFRNGAYGYSMTSAGFNMPSIWINSNIGNTINDDIKLKKVTFMEERTDMLNVIDHSMPLSKWLKDFFTCNTLLWWNWNDMRPFISHIKDHLVTSFFKKS